MDYILNFFKKQIQDSILDKIYDFLFQNSLDIIHYSTNLETEEIFAISLIVIISVMFILTTFHQYIIVKNK